MARDYVTVGSTPAEEDCAQVGSPGYDLVARDECRRFVELLRKTFGPEPEGARLAVKAFSHDFGTYHEVVCYYDPTMEESVAYAFRCEGEAPTRWEE